MLCNHTFSYFLLFLYYWKLFRIQGDLIDDFINDINEFNSNPCIPILLQILKNSICLVSPGV